MSTVVLSIRIRKELKEEMDKFKDVDWRREIEMFIESKIRELRLKQIFDTIDKLLEGIPPSRESAWETIREFREGSHHV